MRGMLVNDDKAIFGFGGGAGAGTGLSPGVATVVAAIQADPRLSGRLALWGRRPLAAADAHPLVAAWLAYGGN